MFGITEMARTRRNRRTTAVREPNGRVQREREFEPALIRRLRDAALRGLRDAEWGTELGMMYLQGELTEGQYAAGIRWAREAADYMSGISIFPVRSANLEKGIET